MFLSILVQLKLTFVGTDHSHSYSGALYNSNTSYSLSRRYLKEVKTTYHIYYKSVFSHFMVP